MWSIEDYVLAYCRHIYGAQILYRNRAVYIKTADDIYRIDLDLADRKIYCFHSMTKPLRLVETCLARGFFRLSAHAAYKEANRIPTNEDWEKFVNNAYVFVEKNCA